MKLSANTGTTATTALPTEDATGGTVVGSSGGLFALTSDSTVLDCGPPPPVDGGADPDAAAPDTPCTSSSIIDFVGYGTTGTFAAPVWEGSGAAPTSNTDSVVRRKGAGCVETDDNAADFELVAVAGGPAPRNSASPTNDCTAADGGADAADAVATDAVTADADAAADSGPADTGAADAMTDVTAETSADSSPEDTAATPDTTPTDTGTTPADTGAAADTGPAAPDEVLEDDGCSCRIPGRGESRNTAPALGIAVLAGVVVLLRRRR